MRIMRTQAMYNYSQHVPRVDFRHMVHYIPELMSEQLPTSFYSRDILRSECAEKFWMLPDLRQLLEPPINEQNKFREQFVKKQYEDPERLLRFSFAVVQRYLRPGETRRRSWFINLAFAVLQRRTTRLRSTQRSVSPYSETQTYFYLQLVHATLSQLMTTDKSEAVRGMSYPLFKETFAISPSAWEAYYSPQLWDSVQARARFVPPDLKPLPDTIDPSTAPLNPDNSLPSANQPFHDRGLIPELPSLEVLHFHHSILLEDTKPLKPTPTPGEVTSHAHLLKYIHAHLILPSLTSPNQPPLPNIRHHLALLTTSSPLPPAHLTTTLTLTHHLLSPPHLQNTDYNPPLPPPTPFIPSHTDPATGHFTRHHNCPCHYESVLPYAIGPNAVCYPHEPPYEHPPQLAHGCLCHEGEALDQDAFAAECAGSWGRLEEGGKRRRGEWWDGGVVRDGAGGEEGFGEWVAGLGMGEGMGLVLGWEEGWRVVSGREGEVGVRRVDGNGDGDGGNEKEEVGGDDGGVGQKGEDGSGGATGAEDGADERTLAETDVEEEGVGERGENDDEWEVLSQHTLC